jgi:hypothetical protein
MRCSCQLFSIFISVLIALMCGCDKRSSISTTRSAISAVAATDPSECQVILPSGTVYVRAKLLSTRPLPHFDSLRHLIGWELHSMASGFDFGLNDDQIAKESLKAEDILTVTGDDGPITMWLRKGILEDVRRGGDHSLSTAQQATTMKVGN